MKLHGSIEANLAAAVRSAKRLRGQPVHADTTAHWKDLLHQARRNLAVDQPPEKQEMRQLIAELEAELSAR